MTIHFAFTKLVVADLEGCAGFYAPVFSRKEQYRVHSEIAGRPIEVVEPR
jgi:hypothetical protein